MNPPQVYMCYPFFHFYPFMNMCIALHLIIINKAAMDI